jgi:hypothetical protein
MDKEYNKRAEHVFAKKRYKRQKGSLDFDWLAPFTAIPQPIKERGRYSCYNLSYHILRHLQQGKF